MLDHAAGLDRLQAALAREVRARPWRLNRPGRSLACKVDPLYYLALSPLFLARWAGWALMAPGDAAEVLLRTGSLVSRKLPSGRKTELVLRLRWPGGGGAFRVQFFLAETIDRALLLHGGTPAPGVSSLRVDPADEALTRTFLQGKTPLAATAFASSSPG